MPYKVQLADGEELSIQSAAHFPVGRKVATVWEPTVDATIITPTEYVGGLMSLCQDRRGELTDHTVLSPTKTMMRSDPRPMDIPPSPLRTNPHTHTFRARSLKAAA